MTAPLSRLWLITFHSSSTFQSNTSQHMGWLFNTTNKIKLKNKIKKRIGRCKGRDGERTILQDRMTSAAVWLFSVSNLWFDWCWNNQPPPRVYSLCRLSYTLCAGCVGGHKSCRGGPFGVHWRVGPIGGQAVGGMYNPHHISYRLGCLSRRTDGHHHLSARGRADHIVRSWAAVSTHCQQSRRGVVALRDDCWAKDNIECNKMNRSRRRAATTHSDHLCWLNSSVRFRIRKLGNDFQVCLLLLT